MGNGKRSGYLRDLPLTARAQFERAAAAALPRGTTRGRVFEAIRDIRSSHPKRSRPGQDLRILIVGPPKCGNLWMQCLLSHAYGLRWIDYGGPDEQSLPSLARFVERGGFEPGTIFHRHYRNTPELMAIVRDVPSCHLVTLIRDPYDLFVSLYHHIQNFPARFRREGGRHQPLIGKPLDHPDVLAFLADGYRPYLRNAAAWIGNEETTLVRYEELHRDPAATLTRVTEAIRPVDPDEIERAVDACRADRMRSMNPHLAKHVRSATVGDSHQRLGPEHLAIFRDRYADQIRALGYEVR